MKRLILIRHGQTQISKSDPERTLTIEGEDSIADAAEKIMPYLVGRVVILHSPTLRTRQSAIVIGEVIGCEDIRSADLRMIGPEFLAARANAGDLLGISAAVVYMRKMHIQPDQIETPAQLVNRFDEIFKSYEEETVIAVSHEPSIRAFMEAMSGYDVLFKSFESDLLYADFIVLERK